MHRKELLAQLSRLVQRYRDDYYSSERYLPRKLCPVIRLADIKQLMKRPDALQVVQHFYCNVMGKAYLLRLSDILTERTMPTQMIALEAAVVNALGHGDCGELTGKLVIELMEMKVFPLISKYFIDAQTKSNHAYVVVTTRQGDQIVLDPFFNICCDIREYKQQAVVNDYFKSLIPGWEFPDRVDTRQYPIQVYAPMITTVQAQVKALDELRHPDLEKLKMSFRQLAALSKQPFSLKLVKPFLMEAFSTSLKHDGESLDPVVIEYEIDSELDGTPEQLARFSLFCEGLKDRVIAQIKSISKEGHKNLHDCLDQRQFSRALRIACTSVSDTALQIVTVLLESKDILLFDVNEQAGPQQKAAIHYALKNGDERFISILLAHGADSMLADADGNTAEKFFQKKKF